MRDMNSTVVLMQAGYLTVREITGSGKRKEYHLKIPNNEVMDSIRLEMLGRMMIPPGTDDPLSYLNQKYLQFLDAFGARDEEKCEQLLTSIFGGIVQRGTGIRNEFFFQSLLQLLLEFGNKWSFPEQFSDIGRADLAVQTLNDDWVIIEIKHEKADADQEAPSVASLADARDSDGNIVVGKKSEYVLGRLAKNIDMAFKQIEEKNYVKKFIGGNAEVYAGAVAIYGMSDVMVKFRKVVWESNSAI